jgi:Mannosyl-glycoprotein endo-beta-N-acetylglucosaminidase/D-alanyl-D-alanine carboxypeptidase
MATESFAQGRITGEPGRQFRLRGGGVPTSDIPNLPKADPSMPTANYPNIPTIRYQEMSLGGQDWSRRAGQLQQENLPSSFEHGIKRIAAAAGSGQEYMGKQISEGSRKLAAGFANLADGMREVQTKLQHETQNTVGAKEDVAYDVARAKFNLRVEKEGISSTDYQEQFWNNEGKEYLQTVEGLKAQGRSGIFGSGKVADDLDSKVVGRQAGFQVFALNKQADETHKSNVQAHTFRFENSIAENRFDDARTAMNDARAANSINDGEKEKWKATIESAEDKWYTDAVINGPRPDIAQKEANKVLKATDAELEKGKVSDLFPRMDKVEARRVSDLATKAVAEKEKKDSDALLEMASRGNASEAQLRQAAKERNMDPKTTESVVKSVSENRPYDEKKAADAWTVVNLVDFRDPKTALTDLRKVQQLILDTTDKRTQEILLKEVGQKWDKRDQPTSLQTVESQATTRMIESWYPSTDKEWEEKLKGTPSEFRERERNRLDKERMELHMASKKYLEDNPEFDPGKLREFIVGKHTPKLQEDSKKAVSPAPTAAVDVRRPYLGAAGTPVVPKPGTGPISLSPEDIEARQANAQQGKPKAAEPGYAQTGAGYVVPGAPGQNVQPEAVPGTQTPAPTPYVPPFEPQPTTPSPTPLVRNFIAPSPPLVRNTPPENIPYAEPVHGYSPSPTPIGGVPRVASPEPERAAAPAQPPVVVKPTGEVARYSHMGGALSGKQDAFTTTANKYGIDPTLLMAISAHETGNGTSEFLTKYNNPGGLMDPKTNWSTPQKFATLEEGIDAMARNLKEKYLDQGLTTIPQIAEKYAPANAANDPRGLNKHWPVDVAAIQSQLKGEAPAGQPRETVATATAATPEEIANIDTRSRTNIETLKPEARQPISNFVAKAIKWGAEHGVKVVVTEGYRSPERQNELYAQGRTKPGKIVTNARAGQSRHQSARAVDIALIKDGKMLEGKEYEKYIKELGKMGVAMGLEWGGNFKSIYDPDHFQFNG